MVIFSNHFSAPARVKSVGVWDVVRLELVSLVTVLALDKSVDALEV